MGQRHSCRTMNRRMCKRRRPPHPPARRPEQRRCFHRFQGPIRRCSPSPRSLRWPRPSRSRPRRPRFPCRRLGCRSPRRNHKGRSPHRKPGTPAHRDTQPLQRKSALRLARKRKRWPASALIQNTTRRAARRLKIGPPSFAPPEVYVATLIDAIASDCPRRSSADEMARQKAITSWLCRRDPRYVCKNERLLGLASIEVIGSPAEHSTIDRLVDDRVLRTRTGGAVRRRGRWCSECPEMIRTSTKGTSCRARKRLWFSVHRDRSATR
jgi:hypothetical protein